MARHDEFNLRCDFELNRLSLLAGRLLSLSGARTMVIFLGHDGSPEIFCSSGCLNSAFDFVGDALVDCPDDDRPLSEILQRS